MDKYAYFLVNFFTIVFPFGWSFHKDLYFYSKWKPAFISIGISAAIFLLWDILFTWLGVWGFNERYILGVYIFNLPIEEIMFFVAVPFACIFSYEAIHHLLKDKIKPGIFYQVSLVLGLFLFLFGLWHYDKYYTCSASIGASLLLAYHCMRKKQISHEIFWLSYLAILVPFTAVNGVLTGYFTPEPIVWYNDSENLGIRFLTIPIEDFVYNLFLLLLNVTIFEKLGRGTK